MAWPPGMATVWAARVPSASQQLLCVTQMLLPTVTVSQQPIGDTVTKDPEVLHCQPHTQGRAVPIGSCSMSTPLPPISGAGDALQRCIENKDNMHSSQHTKAKENKDSPFREGPLGELRLSNPISKHPPPGWTFCRMHGTAFP